jgi:subtilase-type serine protease
VFGDTYYEWRQASGGYLPEAVERPIPMMPPAGHVRRARRRACAPSTSWGISTRNMTAAALDAQYARIGAGYGVYGSIYKDRRTPRLRS